VAAGRIINRTLLARVADLLNLEGVKRFPSVLDLNDIKAVIDIGRFDGLATPGAGQGVAYAIGEEDDAVGGSDAVGYVIGLADGLPGGKDISWRVDHLDFRLEFDAAGRTAMIDKQVSLQVRLFDTQADPGPQVTPIYLASWFYGVLGGPLIYPWTLHGWSQGAVANFGSFGSHTWHGVVPAYGGADPDRFWGLQIIASRVDGLNFPANTTKSWYAMVRKSDNTVPPVSF
jgi:hypothetical protein